MSGFSGLTCFSGLIGFSGLTGFSGLIGFSGLTGFSGLVVWSGLDAFPGSFKNSMSAPSVESTNLGLGVGRGLRSGLAEVRGLGLGEGFAFFFETFSNLSRSSSILEINSETLTKVKIAVVF